MGLQDGEGADAYKRLDPCEVLSWWGTTRIAQNDLRDQLDDARRRLDLSTDLLARALDLIELFSWGVDLDEARRLANELRRDANAERGRRRP